MPSAERLPNVGHGRVWHILSETRLPTRAPATPPPPPTPEAETLCSLPALHWKITKTHLASQELTIRSAVHTCESPREAL